MTLDPSTIAYAGIRCGCCKTQGVQWQFNSRALQGIRETRTVQFQLQLPNGWSLIPGAEPDFQCSECAGKHSDIPTRRETVAKPEGE